MTFKSSSEVKKKKKIYIYIYIYIYIMSGEATNEIDIFFSLHMKK